MTILAIIMMWVIPLVGFCYSVAWVCVKGWLWALEKMSGEIR